MEPKNFTLQQLPSAKDYIIKELYIPKAFKKKESNEENDKSETKKQE